MKGCGALPADEVAQVRNACRRTCAEQDRALLVRGSTTGFRISKRLSVRVGDGWPPGHFVDQVAVHRRHMKGKIQGRSVIVRPDTKAVLPT